MNPDILVQLVQKGWRVSLGATATLIETLQDPQRRSENFLKLRDEFGQLAEAWELKGETTEQEARSFVDRLWSQRSTTSTPPPPPASSTPAPSSVKQDLQELTSQIAAMRAELERLRGPQG